MWGGCRRGTSSIYQALVNGIDTTPVDFSSKAVLIASKNLKRYGLPDNSYSRYFSLPFEEGTFDVVLSMGVMEHIEKRRGISMHVQSIKEWRCLDSMNVPEKPLIFRGLRLILIGFLKDLANFL